MTPCGKEGTGACSTESSEDPEVGTWIGLTIGIWILLLIFIWLIRTCYDPQRRRRLLEHLRCCPDHTVPHQSPPPYSSQLASNHSSGLSLYFIMTQPPPYDEVVKVNGEERRREAVASEPRTAPAITQTAQPIQTAALSGSRASIRKSRSTASMHCLSLATIREDADEPSLAISTSRTLMTSPAPLSRVHQQRPAQRSQSHPARLSDLSLTDPNIDDLSDVTDEEDNTEDEARKYAHFQLQIE